MKRKRGKAKPKRRRRRPARTIATHPTAPEVAAIIEAAVVDHKAGRLIEAEDGYRRALDLDPDHPDALNLLGMIAQDVGHPTPAIELIEQAIKISPQVAAYHLNLGNALLAANRMPGAVAAFRESSRLDPTSLAAAFNLALSLKHLGESAAALAAFERVLVIDPSFTPASHLIAALTGEHRDSAPDAYVAGLFDFYAGAFDRHLDKLGYDIPRQLRALAGEVLGPDAADLRILDLGCGTGLCGVQFRDLAATLIGCDLSPGMLARAASKQVYDELEVEELTVALSRFDDELDIVIAADVFIYIGALERVFAGCRSALREGGLLVCSVESADTGFPLRESGRFAHAEAYVARVAEEHGFTMPRNLETTIRNEDGAPIPGRIYVLERNG